MQSNCNVELQLKKHVCNISAGSIGTGALHTTLRVYAYLHDVCAMHRQNSVLLTRSCTVMSNMIHPLGGFQDEVGQIQACLLFSHLISYNITESDFSVPDHAKHVSCGR